MASAYTRRANLAASRIRTVTSAARPVVVRVLDGDHLPGVHAADAHRRAGGDVVGLREPGGDLERVRPQPLLVGDAGDPVIGTWLQPHPSLPDEQVAGERHLRCTRWDLADRLADDQPPPHERQARPSPRRRSRVPRRDRDAGGRAGRQRLGHPGAPR